MPPAATREGLGHPSTKPESLPGDARVGIVGDRHASRVQHQGHDGLGYTKDGDTTHPRERCRVVRGTFYRSNESPYVSSKPRQHLGNHEQAVTVIIP